MKAFHNQDKEHGRKEVPLPKTETMTDPPPRNTIEKNFCASHRKNCRDPICPITWTTDCRKELKEKDPANQIEGFGLSILNMTLGNFHLDNVLAVPRT
jgi:hypothetical protein